MIVYIEHRRKQTWRTVEGGGVCVISLSFSLHHFVITKMDKDSDIADVDGDGDANANGNGSDGCTV